MAVKFAPPRPTYGTFDPLMRQVAALGYRACRRFLAKNVVGLEKYPRFRYKYKALASDAAEPRAKQLRDILVESRLWLSSARDFNDPFDMTARVVFEPKTPQDLRQRFKSLLAQTGKPWKVRREMLDRFMARPATEWLATAREVFGRHFDETGVFSFRR